MRKCAVLKRSRDCASTPNMYPSSPQRLNRRLVSLAHVGGEAETQQIEEIYLAAARDAEELRRTERRLPVCRASIVCSTPRVVKSRKKRIPRTQREKSERRTPIR